MLKDLSLTPGTLSVIRHKATEPAFSGLYNAYEKTGTYLCRACGLALFRADTKFISSCGWPSFDAAIKEAVCEQPDADAYRVEILCKRCLAHLGHVFNGEGFTDKNRRYCVNSLSLDFVTHKKVIDTEEAIVAGGCFWGIQSQLDALTGIVKTEVGYTGGERPSPTYQAVCAGGSGHFEAVRIVYDSSELSYLSLIQYFLGIHNPFQCGGQGPDRGPQYRSAIFYYDSAQKLAAEKLLQQAQDDETGTPIATLLLEVGPFWAAEAYHQKYYQKSGKKHI